MDPQLWGRQGWHFLHAVTLSYPERPTQNQKKRMANFFNELQYVLPCRVCQQNFQNHMKQIPIEPFLESRKELVKWLHTIHNLTNTMLGKPQYPLEKLYQKYEQNFFIKRSTLLFLILLISSLLIYLNYESVKNLCKKFYYSFL